MDRITELQEKILRGESLGKKEKCELALICIQRGEKRFKDIPVNWKPVLNGPEFVVGRGGDIRISVEINVRGKPLKEVISIGRSALNAANEMYRGLTSASCVAGEGFEGTEHEGREYIPTRREQMEAWREEMEEILDGGFLA